MNERLFSKEQPLAIADQGCFFVGGKYVESQTDTMRGRISGGQMYVQYQIPARQTQPYPVVMIHGGGQTGVNFLGTPDGRRGWADYFVANGYAVYVVDQPSRGRSGFISKIYGEAANRSAEAVAERFTAPENAKLWPQAELHTQWPGSGTAGATTGGKQVTLSDPLAQSTALELASRSLSLSSLRMTIRQLLASTVYQR